MSLGWIKVEEISFNALLLLEPFHVRYLAERSPDASMGIALNANSAVAWYLQQVHPPACDYVEACIALAGEETSPEAIRQAEIAVLDSIQDWLIYVIDPAKYDELEFLGWEDSSLLEMADFKDAIVIDIGAGTGRLAFTVAPLASTVYALEPVANLRRFLWKKREELEFDNVFPLDGSITQIPLPDDFVDIAMSGHVFGESPRKEYEEMRRVVRDGGMILLHPGTNATTEDEAHRFLIKEGFAFATFEEPGEGLKRKYWKTIHKQPEETPMLKENGYTFVEETKYPHLSEADQQQDKPQPPYEIPLEEGKPLIDLPDPEDLDFELVGLREMIEQRRSVRRYSPDELSLEELSYLLWLTQGVKFVSEKRKVTLRTVPSAGCRHPFETYLSVNRVEGLEAGLYRYAATENKLVALDLRDDFNAELTEACMGQRQVETSAVTFIWAAVPYRTVWRYAERSYRYLYLDAGHVCQNLHLAAEAINCGVCAIGAYHDDAADDLLGFDPPEMFVVYMASLGRKVKSD